MARAKRSSDLWHVPDHLWARIETILESLEAPRSRDTRGRPRVDRRRILDGILFQLRTGCQWNSIPPVYGSDSTIYRYFQIWSRTGTFEKLWAVLVEESPELAKYWPQGATASPPSRKIPGDRKL